MAKAAIQYAKDGDLLAGNGRCRCGGTKILKFAWNEGIPYFLGGGGDVHVIMHRNVINMTE